MDAARLKAIAAVKDALLKAVCKMLGLYGGTD